MHRLQFEARRRAQRRQHVEGFVLLASAALSATSDRTLLCDRKRPISLPSSVVPPCSMQTGRSRRFGAEWLVLLAVQVIVAAAMTAGLLHQRSELGRAEAERLAAQARVIDENLSGQLEGANKALVRIVDEIGETGAALDHRALSKQLRLLTEAMPAIRSMLVLEGTGTVVASSREELTGKNFAQRDYFSVPQRIGDASRLYVSPPFHSSLGTYVVVASRMVGDASGRFAGVATATLDPDYFSVLLRSVLYAPDMRASLLHRDGTVFIDLPERPASSPRSPETEPSSRAQWQTKTTQVVEGQAGAAARTDLLVEMRPLGGRGPTEDRPLVVRVSRDALAVFAPWQTQAWEAGGLLAVLVFVSSGSLWLDQRRRQEGHEATAALTRERQMAAERLEQALRGADLGLWELHVPSDTFVINARERVMLGYGPDDPLPQGPAWRTLIHPDDQAGVAAAIVPHLRGKAPAYDCNHRMRHRDGHDIWVSSCAMIVERCEDGAPLRIVGTHLDITDRKNAEMKLLLSERRLKAVNDNVPAIVAHLDRDGRYLTANEAFRRIFAIDPATMLGRTLREIRGEAVFAQMEPHLAAVLQGETRRFEVTDTIDGTEHHFQHSFIPDLDEIGLVQGYYSVGFDITDLRRSEALLIESSARHRAIVEEQSELVSLARQDGELVYVNRAHAEHFGRPAAALVGGCLFSLVMPADREMARSVIADVFATGNPRSGDSRVFSADGTQRWVAWTNTLQRDGHGGVLLRSVGRDITDQRRAERALRASQRFLARTGRVAGVGGWEVDLERGTLTWSEQVRRIHEVADDYVPTLEGAVGFYAPEARPVIQAAVERGIETGESFDLELRLVTATGRSVWVRAVGDVESMQGKAVRLVGAFQDITVRKLAEQAVEHQKRLLRAVTDNLPVFIMYIDSQQTVRFVNATAEKWLGLPPEASVGRHLSEALGPVAYDARRLQVERALEGESLRFEVQGHPAGRVRDLEQHYIPDLGADGSVRGVFAMIHDITEAKETERKLEELARVDTLTGLPNRRQFDEKLEEALRRSRRTLQHVAVMYLDIDHFKAINDSLGHAGGDAVLKEFGARLKASVRDTDLAARLAGDEFVVLLEGMTLADDASGVAQKVVDAMRLDFEVDGSPVHVTTSLGIGFSSDTTATAADLLACADHALYEAKREGRDGFRLSNFGASSLGALLPLRDMDAAAALLTTVRSDA